MHWEGRQPGRLIPPMGLVGRILVDQVSTEDKQALEQGRGHVGPVEFDDVLPDHRQATTGTSYYGDTGFSTDVLEDLISALTKSTRLLGVMGFIRAGWETWAFNEMDSILGAVTTVPAGPVVTVDVRRQKAKAWAPHP